MNPQVGKWLMGLGGFLVGAGLLIYLFYDKLHWLGRLPGDIRIERENFRMYLPLTTCLLVTVLINVVLWLMRKWF
ncbi:hypothetical protein BWI93_21875 [Siphonobacter sp. BAB-5385]|uniref:DUF2905 domain-containing protein n=1 Tax=unclassified Siphonobacter TaxID=2635712 RepID=UPI000B9E7AA3|nr:MULTISPECIES: DUF2905 domain-containing protein [unclassified Siphonobacter]OZI06151.1 hypothetical protein BWI93_21875 [Siphonobacter sp. BAB-5385]PMD94368.1 hypothetical protein BWI97_16810 [Siphonobacter sp. BAB-5405]